MTVRILIIGGYGNFGSFIATALAVDSALTVIIAGRAADKAQALAQTLNTEWAAIDINNNFEQRLAQLKPDIVIHTSGPFQNQSYQVAEACIARGCHYVDLADARAFVTGITALHGAAQAAGILVVSGASSVPCLTAAIIDVYRHKFQKLQRVDYAITTAQRTNRGLATTRAVLGYAGKPFTTLIKGQLKKIYGWQHLHFHKFKGLGWKPLGNCDVPDLALFPQRYPQLQTIRFYAGLELPFEHLGLWLLTWLVRCKLIPSLDKAAPLLLKLSRLFDMFGSDRSGFYMTLSGTNDQGQPKSITFDLVATGGFGPYIPCMPSILLAKKLARGDIITRGAQPGFDVINLDEYLAALQDYEISWSVTEN